MPVAIETLLEEIAQRCVRCGICQSVCPVFAEVQKESAVARGKVSLIRKRLAGELEWSRRLSTYVLQCLGCGACSENCPNGVRADDLILACRALMVEEKGLSLPKWVVFRTILRSPFLLRRLLVAGSLLSGFLFKKIPEESGLRLRFALPYLDKERWIPPIASPFFLDRFDESLMLQVAGEKVRLFVGCTIQYLFPSIGEATVRLLGRSGYGARAPRDQACCGLPAFGSGDLETAKALAARNIEAFEGALVNRILVPCASCFYFLKEGYLRLFPNDPKVKAFSEKITEPSLLFDPVNLGRRHIGAPGPPSTIRLTYHDPCHLRRGMKIYQEPRRLLRSLPGVEFVEMKQPNRCCGMAGSFNLVYYDLSRRILEKKVQDIDSTRADGVVTSCMGCLIQLKDGLSRTKRKIKALHLIEALEGEEGPSSDSLTR